MVSVAEITAFLRRFAPPELAEEWDNVGLLLGDETAETQAVMTCLTLTSEVAAEAIESEAGLIVSHHPLMFRPVQQITSQTAEGRVLLDLIAAGIAVFSPHTGYDSAAEGINQQLAELLELRNVTPLRPASLLQQQGGRPSSAETGAASNQATSGGGRRGHFAKTLSLQDFNERVKSALEIRRLQYVGREEKSVGRVAVACGSAAEFLQDAEEHGCDVLLTGEARFHACLEARSRNVALVLTGHYSSERFAMERLATVLNNEFSQLRVWPSRRETDPVRWA